MIEQQRGHVCYLQFSHFQQFPNLTHGIFQRHGGYSEAPYASLNTLGSLKNGDNISHVVSNRQRILHTLDLPEQPCATLWNIHGADVAVVDSKQPWRTDWANTSYYKQAWRAEEIHKADAILTQECGIALALSFADCVPILLHDPVQQVIGIAHGGWRGTARGVVLATIETMCERFDSRPQNIYAGIGPSIGTCCYEVSEAVQQLFTGQLQFDDAPTHERYRKAVRESAIFSTVQLPHKASLRVDLASTNYNQLLMAGLLPQHIEAAGICTCCHKDDFFSHRGEHGKTGRFPAIMAIKPPWDRSA